MTRNIKRKYEDLIDDLSRDEDERYVDFLRERPETLVYQNLVFDVKNLDSYYVCEGCKQRKPKAHCCSGHDLELTEKDVETIGAIIGEVAEMFPRLKPLAEGGKFWRWGDGFEKMMRRRDNDDCIFLMPGAKGCYLHAWAASRGLDPLECKPYICGLYPLTVLIIGDDVVITTVNKESADILDCGSHSTPCCTRRGRPQDHALVRSRDMIVKMFGERVYDLLRERVLGKD